MTRANPPGLLAGVAAVLAAVALAGCGGDSGREPPAGPDPSPRGAASDPPPAVSPQPGLPGSPQAVAALAGSAPVDAARLPTVLAALPDELGGAVANRTDEGVSYTGPDGLVFLEVSDAQDVYPGLSDGQELLDRLVTDRKITVIGRCPSGPVKCVTGTLQDGQAVALWLPEPGELVVVAVGPSFAAIQPLIDRWSA